MARNLDKVYRQIETAALGVRLKADEHPILVLQGSGVVELRANGVADRRGARGSGSRPGNGSPSRVDPHHGTVVSEPGVPRLIDSEGTTIITTHRVLYTSPNWNRAWEYAKTVEVFHSDAVAAARGWGASYIEVSNRKKTSGFTYRSGFARSVRDRLMLAVAAAEGTLEDMVLALKAEKAELERS